MGSWHTHGSSWYARTISRHADGISRYTVPASADQLLPLPIFHGFDVCGRGIANNSVKRTSCQKWVCRKCSGIKGNMCKVMKTFVYRGCVT